MSKQTECHAPALPVAIESGRLLIDAHDQSDAMLQIAIDEAHALTYAEVLAPTDLGGGASSEASCAVSPAFAVAATSIEIAA